MIRMETKECTRDEWHDVVSQFSDLSLIQVWEYGEAKACLQGWRAIRHIFYEDGVVVGAAQAALKTIPLVRKGIVWINRAPLWCKNGIGNDPAVLIEMLELLKRYWGEEKKMYLRIAPTCYETSETENMMKGLGYDPLPESQWVSSRINLLVDEGVLAGGLEKKWRNCLHKAKRLGVTYQIGNHDEFFSRLINDYQSFLHSKQYTTSVTPEFIAQLQVLLPPERKMFVVTGELNGKSLGCILIACYGTVAEYLVGAVNEEGKRVNAGQFLLWNAICEMKRKGFTVFDVGGTHPKKTPPGILHFKQGLNGKEYSLVGEFEYVKGFFPRAMRLVVKFLT